MKPPEAQASLVDEEKSAQKVHEVPCLLKPALHCPPEPDMAWDDEGRFLGQSPPLTESWGLLSSEHTVGPEEGALW